MWCAGEHLILFCYPFCCALIVVECSLQHAGVLSNIKGYDKKRKTFDCFKSSRMPNDSKKNAINRKGSLTGTINRKNFEYERSENPCTAMATQPCQHSKNRQTISDRNLTLTIQPRSDAARSHSRISSPPSPSALNRPSADGAAATAPSAAHHVRSRRPAALLQVDLSLQRLGQVDHKQLAERRPEGDPRNQIQVPFGPDAHNLDATARPDLLAGRRHRLLLDVVAAHDVHEAGRDVRRVDAATVRHAAPLHARRGAVEVLVLAPVQVAVVAQPAAVELLEMNGRKIGLNILG